MSKPCEYCGADLPLGIDKHTRRIRSHHFASCKAHPLREPSPDPRLALVPDEREPAGPGMGKQAYAKGFNDCREEILRRINAA